MTIDDYAEAYLAGQYTSLLTHEDVVKYIIKAAREYSAWGRLLSLSAPELLPVSEREFIIDLLREPQSDQFRIKVSQSITGKTQIQKGSIQYSLYNAAGLPLQDGDIKTQALILKAYGTGYLCVDQAIGFDHELTLTHSEWGVIQVLANLFCEKESALIQESSRVVSHEPFGRSSSEVEQEITNYRNEYFRNWAFDYPCKTV